MMLFLTNETSDLPMLCRRSLQHNKKQTETLKLEEDFLYLQRTMMRIFYSKNIYHWS